MNVLITAGPTREPIDPVRYISNRSSGKMGYAIAHAAAEAGHQVVLVSGPVALPVLGHPGIETVAVETTRQMYEAVESRIAEMDAAIMAAAVADYRPTHLHTQKIKKSEDEDPVIRLEKTEDILGSARDVFGFTGFLVGFAAETQKLLEFAEGKLARKKCDLIVANDVSRTDIGFDVDQNEVLLVHRDGRRIQLPRNTKADVARELVKVIEDSVVVATGGES